MSCWSLTSIIFFYVVFFQNYFSSEALTQPEFYAEKYIHNIEHFETVLIICP